MNSKTINFWSMKEQIEMKVTITNQNNDKVLKGTMQIGVLDE